MRALGTVFIVTCTDGLGVHGDIDEFGTRKCVVSGVSIPRGGSTAVAGEQGVRPDGDRLKLGL
jgi:hypothetical protein